MGYTSCKDVLMAYSLCILILLIKSNSLSSHLTALISFISCLMESPFVSWPLLSINCTLTSLLSWGLLTSSTSTVPCGLSSCLLDSALSLNFSCHLWPLLSSLSFPFVSRPLLSSCSLSACLIGLLSALMLYFLIMPLLSNSALFSCPLLSSHGLSCHYWPL